MNLLGARVWTAQYVAMRALAWPDAFPHTDYGVMKAMNERSPAKVLAAAEKWRRWRAYAAMHLLSYAHAISFGYITVQAQQEIDDWRLLEGRESEAGEQTAAPLENEAAHSICPAVGSSSQSHPMLSA